MGRFLQKISSFLDSQAGMAPAPGAGLPADQRASEPASSAQESLPLEGVDGGNVQDALPVVRPASRALSAVVRASTSVVVARHPMPPAPAFAQPSHLPGGVDLTETEQVRLRIMQAQIKLSHLGLYEGPVNGMMNLDTVAGVRHFQTLKGMRDSGQLTAATMRALMGPALRRP
jgi:hypothetical protein